MDSDSRSDRSHEQDVPRDDPESRGRGEDNRKQMDKVPPPGTDPLHEGP